MSEKPRAQSALELQQMADELARQAAEMATRAAKARQAEEAARRPQEPLVLENLPEFVMFQRYDSGRVYTYAAVGWNPGKGNANRWAVTGQESRRFNWNGLLNFIGEANWGTLYQFTDTVALVPAKDAPPVAERMGKYGRVEGVDVVTPLTATYRPGVDGGYASGGMVP